MDEQFKEIIDGILNQRLQDPEDIATYLQNAASARTYVLTQMQELEEKMRFSSGDELDMIKSKHTEIRRLFFEIQERAEAYSRILSYYSSIVRLER